MAWLWFGQGHTFCTTCWQSWFTRGNRSCPSCRGKPLNAEPVINRYLSGVIDRLQVRCECGHEFSANHLTTHREEECALRLLDCPLQCGWQGPFSSLRDHLPDGCSMMYTTCPKDGCGMIIRRADLVKHKPHCKPLPKVDEKDSDEQNSAAAAAASQVRTAAPSHRNHTATSHPHVSFPVWTGVLLRSWSPA